MSGSDVNAANWGLTGVAIGLTAGRYLIRAGSPGRFHWDDFVHGLALAVLIAHGVTNQVTGDNKSQLSTLVAANNPPTPSDELLAQYRRNSALNTVNNVFLYLVFWPVKIAFLLFYRILFGSNRRFRFAWWGVLVVTFLTFWVPFAEVLATCAGASTIADYKACESQSNFRIAKLISTCVVNVVSDVAVMVLPLWMLRGLQLQKRQKYGLTVVFSLATFTVILDILRTAQAVAQNQALYTVLEINFAVIVSCLPTFQALLVLHHRLKSQGTPYYNSGSNSGSGSGMRRPSHGRVGVSAGRSGSEAGLVGKASPFSSQGSKARPADPYDVEYGVGPHYDNAYEMGQGKGPKKGTEVHVTETIVVERDERDAVGQERARTVATPLGQRSEALASPRLPPNRPTEAEEGMTVFPYPNSGDR